MKKSVIGAMMALAAFVPATASAQLLAFPGAEGFGRFATGGRGGEIYHVTNLNDSGKGSLRDAVSASNRIIVFDVCGVIELKSALVFKGNLTVLGQTAPGEGIQVYGDRVSFSGADNLIVRHMRFRMGITGTSGKDAAGVANGENMIFDHLSVLWGRDENFSISWDNKGTKPANITIQNCIIGQGLQTHSCGGLIQTDGGVTLYRNLYIENKTRNPKVKGVNQYVNNVVYNWGDGGCYLMGRGSEGLSWADIRNNYFIHGNWKGSIKRPLDDGNENFQYYGEGNYYDNQVDGILNGHLLTEEEHIASKGKRVYEWNGWDPENPCPLVHPEIKNLMTAENAVKWMIDSVGPTLPARDEVDWYLIDELKSFGTNSTTNGISSELDLPHKGTGLLHGGYLPTDSDGDGIPDEWENANGLDPNDPTDAAKIAVNGYANIENYVNSMTTGHPYIKIPQEFAVADQQKESITLTWKDLADNEDGYIIEMSTDSKTFTEKGRVGKDVTTYVVTGLEPEKVYYFRVYGYNNIGIKSLYSETIMAETPGDAVAPSKCYAPSPAIGAELGAINEVVLSWKNDTKPFFGEVKYTVYLGNSVESMTAVATDITDLEYNLGLLQAWKDYAWRVDATNEIGTTTGDVWTFKTTGGGELFYCDFKTVPEAWAKTYGDITSNTNIINAANNAKKTVGDMVFGGGESTMRIVALNLDNVAASGDYSPNATSDAGASPRAIQFVTEAAGGYMLTPYVEGPCEIMLYTGNASGKAQTFYLLAVDEQGNESRIAEFKMAAKKRTFKFETIHNVSGKIRYKIDANSGKLNVNDFKITRHIPAGINDVVADGESPVSVYTVGDAVTVNNLPQGATIAIYDMSGRAVVYDTVCADSQSYVLDRGVYVVTVEGRKAVKIVI